MASLPMYDRTGAQVGTYDVDPADFVSRINRQLLHDAVVMYQANLRQGTHKTKSRAEVAGSTKKMYRQKGTGNARAGSRRSGVRRGGGHIFAIRPRDYGYRMPRKAVQLATRMALASRIRDGEVLVIDELSMQEPKTSLVAKMLSKMGCEGKSVLLGIATHDPVVYKSARNIEGLEILPVADFNALAILKPRVVVVTKAGIDSLRERAKAVAVNKLDAAKKAVAAS